MKYITPLKVVQNEQLRKKLEPASIIKIESPARPLSAALKRGKIKLKQVASVPDHPDQRWLR